MNSRRIHTDGPEKRWVSLRRDNFQTTSTHGTYASYVACFSNPALHNLQFSFGIRCNVGNRNSLLHALDAGLVLLTHVLCEMVA